MPKLKRNRLVMERSLFDMSPRILQDDSTARARIFTSKIGALAVLSLFTIRGLIPIRYRIMNEQSPVLSLSL